MTGINSGGGADPTTMLQIILMNKMKNSGSNTSPEEMEKLQDQMKKLRMLQQMRANKEDSSGSNFGILGGGSG